MATVNLDDFLQMGRSLQFLRYSNEGYVIHGDPYVLAAMKDIFEGVANLKLVVTGRSDSYLNLQRLKAEFAELPNDAGLTKEQSSRAKRVK